MWRNTYSPHADSTTEETRETQENCTPTKYLYTLEAVLINQGGFFLLSIKNRFSIFSTSIIYFTTNRKKPTHKMYVGSLNSI